MNNTEMADGSDSVFRLRVLTFNTWQVPFVSHYPKERLEAFLNSVKSYGKYDIIALQEVFTPQAQKRVYEVMPQLGLRYIVSFISGSELPGRSDGSGCMVCSRYPILDSLFLPFAASGRPYRIDQWDWQAGKGIGLARILLPGAYGTADVYVTHLVAQYHEGEADLYASQRALQAVESSMFVRATRRSDLTLLLGDMNSPPDSLPIRTLLSLAAFKDAYSCTHTPEDALRKGGTITHTRSLSVPNINTIPRKKKHSRAIVPLRSIFDPTFGLPDNVYARPGGALNNLNQATAIVMQRLGIASNKKKVEERHVRLDYIFFGTAAFGPSAWPFQPLDCPSTPPRRAWHVLESDIRMNELFHLSNGAAINISDHSAVYAELGCVFVENPPPRATPCISISHPNIIRKHGLVLYNSPSSSPSPSSALSTPSMLRRHGELHRTYSPLVTTTNLRSEKGKHQENVSKMGNQTDINHAGFEPNKEYPVFSTFGDSIALADTRNTPQKSSAPMTTHSDIPVDSKTNSSSAPIDRYMFTPTPPRTAPHATPSTPCAAQGEKQIHRPTSGHLTSSLPELSSRRVSSPFPKHEGERDTSGEKTQVWIDPTLSHWLLLLESLEAAGVPIARVAGIYSRDGQWLENPEEEVEVGEDDSEGVTCQNPPPLIRAHLIPSASDWPHAQDAEMPHPSPHTQDFQELDSEQPSQSAASGNDGADVSIFAASEIMENISGALRRVLAALGVGGIPSLTEYMGSILPMWSPSMNALSAELHMETARLLSEVPGESWPTFGDYSDESDFSSCQSSELEYSSGIAVSEDEEIDTSDRPDDWEGLFLESLSTEGVEAESGKETEDVKEEERQIGASSVPQTIHSDTVQTSSPFLRNLLKNNTIAGTMGMKPFSAGTAQLSPIEDGELQEKLTKNSKMSQSSGILSGEGGATKYRASSVLRKKGPLPPEEVHTAIKNALISTSSSTEKHIGEGHRQRKPPGILWRKILQENIISAARGLREACELRSIQYRMVGVSFGLSLLLSLWAYFLHPQPHQVLLGFFTLGVLLAGTIVGFFIILFRSLSWKLLLTRLCILIMVIISTVIFFGRKGGITSVLIALSIFFSIFGSMCALFASIMTVQEIHAFKRGIEQLQLLLSRPPAIIA